MSPPKLSPHEHFAGLLLGTAVGDSLGLPAEGMSRGRIQRRWQGIWQHRFLLGRGMISDDTEHTIFVAQALLAHPDDVSAFQRRLACKFRLWLLGLPAGIGLATLKSILRLWVGFPPERSGVFSAGNGPAMRSAIIGAYFADDASKRRAYVSASTRITHTDPRAETAALAVAEAAAWAINPSSPVEDWLAALPGSGNDSEWKTICDQIMIAVKTGKSVDEFANALGLQQGITGYAYHTVPIALFAFLRHGEDVRAGLESVLNCGGDTDTAGAITGALIGTRMSVASIPKDWTQKICDQPRSVRLLYEIASRLSQRKASGHPLGPVRYFWPLLPARNFVFLMVVLFHGLRRLLPPY